MKKIRKRDISVFSALAMLLLITSCNTVTKPNEEEKETEKASVTVVADTFKEQIEALKAEKFDNISFDNLKTYSFPDVSKITTYKVKEYEFGNGLSSEQFFENFVTYCNYLEPGKHTREELAEKTIIMGKFGDSDSNYNYNQFKELNQSGDLRIDYIELEIPNLYFAYFGHGPYWYIDDKLLNLYKSDAENPPRSPMSVSLIDDSHPIVFYTEDMSCTDTYHLIDGDISIADAAKKANELMANMAEQCDDDMTERIVCAVKVVDIGDGCFAYDFTTTPVVNGIKYAYADSRSDAGSFSFSEEGGDHAGSGDSAVMIESGKLHSFINAGGWKEKTPIDDYESIVTLKAAAENAVKMLSGEMKFKAKSVTLVYDLKGGSDELVPSWRFVLENSLNQKEYYHVYVNAITGEARVRAIQEVNSGYEYD